MDISGWVARGNRAADSSCRQELLAEPLYGRRWGVSTQHTGSLGEKICMQYDCALFYVLIVRSQWAVYKQFPGRREELRVAFLLGFDLHFG